MAKVSEMYVRHRGTALLQSVSDVPDDFPAALLQQCVNDFLGRFKRFAAIGGSDGVLRGFGEWLEEDPRCRFRMLNRRKYTRNGHD